MWTGISDCALAALPVASILVPPVRIEAPIRKGGSTSHHKPDARDGSYSLNPGEFTTEDLDAIRREIDRVRKEKEGNHGDRNH